MIELYNKLYDARTIHSKNLSKLITDHIDTVGNLVILAAKNGLTSIDSHILLDYTRTLLRDYAAERARFENELRSILGMGESNEPNQ